jgi:hypothetical protein
MFLPIKIRRVTGACANSWTELYETESPQVRLLE